MARCTSALFTPCTPEPAAAVVLASGTTRLTWLNVRALLDLNLPAAYWAAAVSQSQPLAIRTHTTSSARLRCLPKHLSAGRTISIPIETENASPESVVLSDWIPDHSAWARLAVPSCGRRRFLPAPRKQNQPFRF
jgi:hypothetical protein